MTNKPFCPDCVGKCELKHYILKQKIVDDVCYFECPCCSKVFNLIEVNPDMSEDENIVTKVHNVEEM